MTNSDPIMEAWEKHERQECPPACDFCGPGPEHYRRAITEQERELAMRELREAVKGRGLRYWYIASACGKHASTIGDTLRGNYPYHGANYLPKYLRVYLQGAGFDVPEILHTH